MTALMILSLLTTALAKPAPQAQTAAQAQWNAAAKSADVEQLKSICTAAGGTLTVQSTREAAKHGNMAQPGMDMASMMTRSGTEQQASCGKNGALIAWEDVSWNDVTIEQPAAR